MPRVSKKRSAVKKMWKRKRGGRRSQLTVNRAIQPIPQRYICRLKYSQPFVLTAVAPVQQFNLNSLYDPDRTGVGHQPYGFDQLAALYNRYRVIATSYVVNATASSAIRVAAIATNTTPAPNSLSDICERPRAKFFIQLPGGNTQYLKGKVYMPSLIGRSKAQYMADDRFQADTAASPQELALLNLYGKALDDNPVDINGVITMEFTVEFFDQNPLSQS